MESKSYLVTMEEKLPDEFKLMAPLFNEENPVDEKEKKFMRKLSDDDIKYFQNDFYQVVVIFIQAITKGVEGTLCDANWKEMIDMSYESFYDQMKELEKSNPEKLDKILAANYIT